MTDTIAEKIRKLNMIIKRFSKTEPEADMIALICLSARGEIYLRNNEKDKLKNIETEIDDAIIIYENTLMN